MTGLVKKLDQNVQISSTNYTEAWDNGSMGNYWNDYTNRYPNATEIDNTEIWNTPYVIDENNKDNYISYIQLPSKAIPKPSS